MSQIEVPFSKINIAPITRSEGGDETLPNFEFAQLWEDQVVAEAEIGAAPDSETSIAALEPDTDDVITDPDKRDAEKEAEKNPAKDDTALLLQNVDEVAATIAKDARPKDEVRLARNVTDDADRTTTNMVDQINPDVPFVKLPNPDVNLFVKEKGVLVERGAQQQPSKGQSAAEGIFISQIAKSLPVTEGKLLHDPLPPANRLADRIAPATVQDMRSPMPEATPALPAPMQVPLIRMTAAPMKAEPSTPHIEPRDILPRNQANPVVQMTPAVTGSMPAAAAVIAQPVLGTQPMTTPNDMDSKLAIGLFEDAPWTLSSSVSPSKPAAFVPAPYTPHHAPKVAAQIVAAAVRSDAGTTEIRLNPDELGRVRIALTSTEAGMTVTILAERFETADLLRRNIESLAQEFRDLGYEDLVFEFGDASDDSSENSNDPQTDNQTTFLESAPSTDMPAQTIAALRGGLDLKL